MKIKLSSSDFISSHFSVELDEILNRNITCEIGAFVNDKKMFTHFVEFRGFTRCIDCKWGW